MAGVLARATSGEVAVVATVAKSVLQIKAATNQRVIVKALEIFGKGIVSTDGPMLVRLTRNSASFGTFSSVTANKNDPSDAETLQTTFNKNATVEPTTPTDAGESWEVHPQTGLIYPFPPGQEIKIPGGQSLQIEVTAPQAQTVVVTALIEE